ncbi:MAG: T9SS type A sorting domain-containing protein [Saprospiraceae bacterium]|nr:T9SS type A sorting domain-containing protein [Saprospiraceae bacterium]
MKTILLMLFAVGFGQYAFAQTPTPIETRNGLAPNERLGAFVDHGFPYKFAVGSPGGTQNGEVVGKIQLYDYINFDLREFGAPIYGDIPNVGFGEVFDLEGDQMVVGMPAYDNNRGLVRVYEWKEDIEEWEQKGSDIQGPEIGCQFGKTVAMKVTGNMIVVGAPYASANGENKGEVRIYTWTGVDWELRGEPIVGLNDNDLTGYHVKISRTQPLVIIGEPGNNVGVNKNGRIRFFEWNGSEWQLAYDDLEGPEPLTGFGIKFDITYHNDRFVVGMPIAEGTKGVVKTYKLNGTNWVQLYNDLQGEEPGDLFGTDLNIVIHGQILIVGAPQGNTKPGYMNVFTDYAGRTNWNLSGEFSGSMPGEKYGSELAISELVENVLVGAPQEDSTFNDAGKIYLYPYILVSTDEQQKIEPLTIFPNPVKDVLHLEGPLNGEVFIYNLEGKLFLQNQLNADNIEVGDLPEGAYILKIETKDKVLVSKFTKVD